MGLGQTRSLGVAPLKKEGEYKMLEKDERESDRKRKGSV